MGATSIQRRRTLKNKRKLSVFALAAAAAALTVSLAYASVSDSGRIQIPRGNWVVGYHTYMGEGYRAIPVRVFSVRSEIGKGVTRVSLRNKETSKTVTALKLKWFVSDDKGTGSVLQQGETPLVAARLAPSDKQFLSFPVVAFENIYKSLMKGNTLSGDFRIQIAVSAITYEDGTTWTWAQPAGITSLDPPEYNHAPAAPCANQTCQYDGTVYHCVDGKGELCTNSGQACDSSACASEMD
jgi:hypothetical protein